MYLGEMALLIVSVLVMTGLVKGITSRLRLNDFTASFMIFVIVLLNLRGGISLRKDLSLSLGGVLSLVVAFYVLIAKHENRQEVLLSIGAAIIAAAIAFVYTLHFSENERLDPRLLAALLSLLLGLWCAIAAKRTFSSCLFSSVTGGFIGVTIYLLFFRKSGNIGGSYSFAVMWLSAIFGLGLQYLLSIMLRAINSPRADSYFEAAEMEEENRENEEKSDDPSRN